MTNLVGNFRLLLIDDDDLLTMDAAALSHPCVTIETVATISEGRERLEEGGYDALAINLALKGAQALIDEEIVGIHASPVLALAATGLGGHTLEYTLTLAELRGAACSAPKPIDAVELVAMALECAAKRGGNHGVRELMHAFERMSCR